MAKLLSNFEAEELLGEILEWWHDLEMKLPEGKSVKKPYFVKMAESFSGRLPGTKPCQKGEN